MQINKLKLKMIKPEVRLPEFIVTLVVSFFILPLFVFAAESTFTTSLTTTGFSTLPPEVPTGLTSVAVSDTQIDLSWNPAEVNFYAVAGYRIFRDSTFLATTTSTSYSDTGLISETAYSYTVEAFDTIFQMSGQSATSTATTTATPIVTPTPSAPSGGSISGYSGFQISNIKIIPGIKDAVVSFTTNVSAQTKVQWGLSNDFEIGSLQNVFYGYEHSQTINGLSGGLNYFIKITATNSQGVTVTKEVSFKTDLPVVEFGPLPNPSDFSAEATEKNVELTWNNPEDERFNNVRIVRSEGFFPIDQFDGVPVYEGDEQSFTDKSAKVGVTYYYAIFARDTDGEYSSGALAKARIVPPGEIFIEATSTDPFINIPESSRVDPMIGELEMSDFEFIQEGKNLSTISDTVAINGGENLTIRLAYDKVPEILKTVAFTLQDPTDKTKVFPFLLRINSDKTYYEATIGALGKSGRYTMSVVILDYENKGLKRLNGTLAAMVFAAPAINLNENFDILGMLILLALIIIFGIIMMKIRKWIHYSPDLSPKQRPAFNQAKNSSVNNIYRISVILLIVISQILFGILPQKVLAAANPEINYQGKLVNTSNAAVPNGSYSVRFKLYTSLTGGSPIWTETWCNTSDCAGGGTGPDNRITVTNGLFSVMLGSTTPFTGVDFNQPLYLSIEVGDADVFAVWDGEMEPRKILGSVPSAFVANTLSGLNSNQFLRSDAQNATSSSSTFLNILQSGAGKIAEFIGTASKSVLSILSSGNVGIGTTSPSAKLSIDQTDGGSDALFSIASSTNGTGTSTALYVASNGNVGIGKDNPRYALDVSGSIVGSSWVIGTNFRTGQGNLTYTALSGASGDPDTGINFPTANGTISLVSNGSEAVRLDNNGNLGIGTTSPFAKLSVAGVVVADSFNATNTAATSTFSGGLIVGGTNGLMVFQNGNTTIGTTSPFSRMYPQPKLIAYNSGANSSIEISGDPGYWKAISLGRWTIGSDYGAESDNLLAGSDFRIMRKANNGYAIGDTQMLITRNTGDISFNDNALVVNNNKNSVAIGTTTPSAKLTIWGANGGSLPLLNLISYASTTLASFFNNGSAYISGNLGLGTTSPFAKLSVAGNSYFGGNITATGSLSLAGSLIDSLNSAGTNGMVLQTTGSATQWVATSSLGFASASQIGSGTQGQVPFYDSNGSTLTATSSLFIAQSGKVGFGTTTPNTKLSVVGNISALADTSFNPTVVGTVTTGTLPTFVSVSGRYAYVTNLNSNSLQIIDISNSSSPSVVGTVTTGTKPVSVSVSGRYAYVVNFTSSSLQVIDISKPSSPVVVGTVTTGNNPYFVSISGHYAYVVNAGSNTMQVIDVSNPSSPTIVGSVIADSFPHSVSVSGRYAYVINSSSDSMKVIDVSNPSSPTIVGSVTTDSFPYSVSVSGRYAYVINSSSNSMQVIDVSNPSSPVVVGTVTTGSNPHSVSVSGRYVYVTSSDSNSLQIIDVSNQSSPVVVGTVTTGINPYSVSVSGRYAYVANYTSNSLQVIDIGGIETTSALVHSLEAGSLQVQKDIYTAGQLSVGSGLNVGAGGIFSSGPISVSVASSTQSNPISAYFQGRVGIGTTSPYAMLSVAGLAVANSFNATNTSATSTFSGGFVAGGTNGLSVLQNGKVGIGTTSPFAKLSVAGRIVADYITATSTTATSSFAYDVLINGGLKLANSDRSIVIGTAAGVPKGLYSIDIQSYESFPSGPSYIGNYITSIGYDNYPFGSNTSSSTLVGMKNVIESGNFSSAFGLENYSYSDDYTSIFGTKNQSDGSHVSLLAGYQNYLYHASSSVLVGSRSDLQQSDRSSVFGQRNSVFESDDSVVLGYYNWMYNENSTSTLVGILNFFDDSASSTVAFGNYNFAAGYLSSSTIIGISNTVGKYADKSSVIGYANTIGTGATSSMIFGSNITNNIAGSMMIGPSDTSKLTILSSGNVGIGTTTPLAKLSIDQTTGGSAPLFSIASSTNGTGTSTALYVASNGNVGIGNAAPASLLHVESATTNADIRVRTTTNNSVASLGLYSNPGGPGQLFGRVGFFDSGSGNTNMGNIKSIRDITLGGATSDFAFETNNGSSLIERMRILYNGNVGIGTSSPFAKLSVAGNSYFGGNITATGSLSLAGSLIDSLNSAGTNGMVLQTTGSATQWVATSSLGFASASQIGSGTQGQVPFYDSNGSTLTATSSLFIAQSGNVGIGTSSPFAKLSIDQTIGGSDPLFSIASSTNGTGTSTALYVASNGNVGIGTMNTGSFNFNVSGSSYFGSTVDAHGLYTDYVTSRFSASNTQIAARGSTPAINFTDTANGNVIMKLLASGNLGIGTTSPYARLSVAGDVVADSFNATNTAATSTFAGGLTAGTNGLTVLQNGNVGVGTTNPAYVLTIKGTNTSNSTNGLVLLDSNDDVRFSVRNNGTTLFGKYASAQASPAQALFLEYSNTQGWPMFIGNWNSSGVWGIGAASGGADNTMRIGVTSAVAATWSANQSAIKLAVGNSIFGSSVGIGTTSPFAKLSVAGDSYIGGNLTATGTLAVTGTGTSTFANGIDLASGCFSVNGVCVGGGTGSGITSLTGNPLTKGYFLVGNDSGLSQATSSIFVSSTGNVGIGTTTPSALLSVNAPAGQTAFSIGSSTKTNFIVNKNGYVGIGSSNPRTALDVTGDIKFDNTRSVTLTRSIPTTLNNEVDIGTFTFSDGGGNLDVMVTVPSMSYSLAKRYILPIQYNQSSGVWMTALPVSATVPFSSNDFALDVNVTGTTATLRLRNTSGYTAGTAYVTIIQQGVNTDGFVASSATSAVTAPTQFFSSSAMTQIGGNVGIGMITPTYRLDVTGFINTDQYSGYKQNGTTILYASTTNQSIFVGQSAGAAVNATGNYNTALGFEALKIATSSDNNSAVGYRSLFYTTTGNSNTSLGSNTMYSNTTGSYNTALGSGALYSNISGIRNTASGVSTLYSNTTGGYNSAHGMYALYNNTSGSYNVADGHSALYNSTSGSANVAIGYNTLMYNSSATNTTAVGYEAGYGTMGGSNENNSLFGYQTGYSLSTGSSNLMLGYQTGYGLTSGSNNILLGYQAGDALVSGSNNILIGNNIDATSTDSVNFLNIGNTIYGNLGTGYVGIGKTNPTVKLDVNGDINVASTNSYRIGTLAVLGLSSPSIGFGNVLGAGGAYDLNFYTGSGINAMKIDSVGNVGIGTSSPYTKLSVAGVVVADSFNATNTAATSTFAGGLTAGTDGLTVLQNGKIGIGTTTPKYVLDVYKNNTSSTAIQITNPNSGANANVALGLGNNTGIGAASIFLGSSNYGNYGGSNSLNIYQYNNAPIAFMTNDSERMRITGSGNVGIGTTTPSALLDVNGSALFGQNIDQSTATPVNVSFGGTYGNSTPGSKANLKWDMYNGGITAYRYGIGMSFNLMEFQTGTNGGFGFYPNGGTTQALGILSNGKVGIGTTSPFAKLSVVGDSYIGGNLTVTGTLAVTGTGTSTFANGIDLASGCFSVNGVCVGGGTGSGITSLTGNPLTKGYFLVGNDSGLSQATSSIFVSSTGNVGIGTTSPTYSLDVEGFINTDVYSGYKQGGVTILYASSTNFSTLVGQSAGTALQSGGQYNTALGYQALMTATSSGSNTAIGHRALSSDTSGYNNVAVGYQSLRLNQTGFQNVAIGSQSLVVNETGALNTAIGDSTLGSNISGNRNTAIGSQALYYNTSGGYNTAIGYKALQFNDTGVYNTALGYQAGLGSMPDQRSVIDNYAVFIGQSASRDGSVSSTTALTNIIAIGRDAKVGASNSMVLGGTGSYAVNVGIGTTSPYSILSISNSATTDANTPLFTIASTTAGNSTTTLFSVLPNGRVSIGSFALSDGGGGNLTILRSSDMTSGSFTSYAITSRYINSSSSGSPLYLGSSGGSDVTAGQLSAVSLANGTYTQTSTTYGFSAVSINPTYNQSGSTAANTDLEIFRKETNIGSGMQYLIDAKVGGSLNSYATSTKFSVDRTGVGYFAGNLGIGTTSPYSILSISNSATTDANTPLFTIASTTAGNSTTTLMTVLANGRVGVGTENPYSSLQVSGTYGGGLDIFRAYTSSGSGLVVSQWGQVGVGTAPYAKFDVFSNSGAGTWTGYFHTDQSTGNGVKILTSSNSSSYYGLNVLGNYGYRSDFTVDGLGYVGIGTSSPSAKLSIDQTVGGSAPLFSIASSTNGTGTSTALYVASNGKIGIGTANPNSSYLLDINGTTNTTRLIIASGAIDISGGGIWNHNYYDGTGSWYVKPGNSSISAILNGSVGIGTSSPYAKLSVAGVVVADSFNATNTAATSTFAGGLTAGTNGLTVLQNGYVGIGTDTPTRPLEVNGYAVISSGILMNAGSYVSMGASGTKVQGGTGYLNLLVDNASKMYINSSGNVGIGTTSPNTTLQVAGSGASTGPTISLNNTNGYTANRLFTLINNYDGTSNYLNLVNENYNRTATTTIVTFRPTGSIGIGTTSPASRLTISATSSLSNIPLLSVVAEPSLGATSTALFVGSNGYVGIGNDNPQEKLHVTGNVYLTRDDTTRMSLLSVGESGGTNRRQSLAFLQGTDGDSDNGIVLGQPFEVTGTAMAPTYTSRNSVITPIGMRIMNKKFEVIGNSAAVTSGSTFTPTSFLTVNTDGLVGIASSTPWAQLSVSTTSATAPAFAVGSSLATDFIVANNGNVGVGLTNPSNPFVAQVAPNTNVSFEYMASSTGIVGLTQRGAGIQFSRPSDGVERIAGIFNYNLYGLAMSARGDVTFLSGGANNYTTAPERMRIISTNGYVGIGTSSPYAMLSVAGVTVADSFNATNTAATSTFSGGFVAGGTNGLSVLQNGRTSIASSTPFANFAINPVAGVAANQFVVGSSTATSFIITNARKVGIGTTSPSYLLGVGNSSVSGKVAQFENSTGSCYINPTTTSLDCASDLRLKKNITSLASTSGIAAITKLRPVTYNWNSEDSSSSTHTGFIAQEVEEVYSDLASKSSDGYYTMNYAGLTPYLVKAVQELNEKGNVIADKLSTTTSNIDAAIATLDLTKLTLASTTVDLLKLKDSFSQFATETKTNMTDFNNQLADLTASTTGLSLNLSSTTALVLDIASTTSYFNSQSFIEKVAEAVKALIQNTGEWVVSKVSATLATFNRIETQTASVSQGLEMKDQTTGLIYCVSINNGNWDKKQGTCQEVATAATTPTPTVIPTVETTPAVTTVQTSTPAATSTTSAATTTTATSTPATTPTSTSTPETTPTSITETTSTSTPETVTTTASETTTTSTANPSGSEVTPPAETASTAPTTAPETSPSTTVSSTPDTASEPAS